MSAAAVASPEAPSVPSLATRTRSVLLRRAAAFSLDLVFGVLVALLFALVPLDRFRFFGAGLILGGLYLLFRDGLPGGLRGRSLGKRLLGLQPIRLGGRLVDLAASARRNWTVALLLLLPGLADVVLGGRQVVLMGNIGLADLLMLVGGGLVVIEGLLVLVDPVARRVGDRLAKTRVIEG